MATKEVKIIKPTVANANNNLIRMAAYCRVSTDSADQVNSFMAQVAYYSEYIDSHDNMTLVDIYADEGITGTSINKREDFKRLIKDCQNRKIDRVIVNSVQRFARNSLECIETVRLLSECGVSVYFETDNIDTKSMNNEMFLYIKSAFAQGESLSASKRVSTSIRIRMQDGTYITSHAPYGYILENGTLVINEAEAIIVRQIFDWYLSGVGINCITARLKETDSDLWNAPRVRYILTNEKYIGDALLQKTFTPAQLPLRNRPNRGELDMYYAEGTHEAIISKEVFEKVKQLLEERGETHGHKNRDPITYPVPFRCRHCGWKFRSKQFKTERLWVCSRKGTAGQECETRSYSDRELDDAFVRMYNILRQNEKVLIDDTISQLVFLRNKLTAGNREIAEIDAEIMKVSEQNNMYAKLYAQNIIDNVTFTEKNDFFKKRIAELRVRRSKLISEDEEEHCIADLKELKRILEDSPDRLLSADTELMQKIVTMVYAEQDGGVTYVLTGGLEMKIREVAKWH